MPCLFGFAARLLVIRLGFRRVVSGLAIVTCVCSHFSVIAIAQTSVDPRTAAGIATPAPAPVVAAPISPQDQQRTIAVVLVKNALLAVNQGNLTGNYTVLRDLASPGFREKNSAADLAVIFQSVRQLKLDMSPIVALEPVLGQPQISADGQISLNGYFEAQQMRINFQLVFIKAPTNGWMIHGVSLNAVPLTPAVATSAGALPPAPAPGVRQ